jgi:hypothetical protein
MPYNFTDDPTPALTTFIDAAGQVQLVNGSPQSELITSAYAGTSVSVSIVPPNDWTLDSVSWTPGNGTIAVPPEGQEDTYSFSYTVSYGAQRSSGGGTFKIKKNGS